MQRGGGLLDAVAFLFAQSDLQLGDAFVEGNDLFLGQDVPAVAQEFARGAKHEIGFLAVTRGEEKHGRGNAAKSRGWG